MDQIYKLTNWFYKNMPPKRNVVLQVQKEISRNTGNYRGGLVRIAGISGAIAVILGAYGAHCEFMSNNSIKQYLSLQPFTLQRLNRKNLYLKNENL